MKKEPFDLELYFVSRMALLENTYSPVPIGRYGSINQSASYIWPCTFSNIWGVTINWINTQFWSTSRGTFDKNNLAPIAYTFVGVSFNWIVTFSMPWGVIINWNMSSNWHQRVHSFIGMKKCLFYLAMMILKCLPPQYLLPDTSLVDAGPGPYWIIVALFALPV